MPMGLPHLAQRRKEARGSFCRLLPSIFSCTRAKSSSPTRGGQAPGQITQPALGTIRLFSTLQLIFRLRFWVGDILHGSGIASDIRKVIDAKFTEANIEISFPQMDVHLRENETVPVELRNPRKVKEPTLQQEDKSDAPEQNG